MNLALIGHGAMGQEHLEVLLELGGVVPQVVAGPNAKAAQDFARRYSFHQATSDTDAALTDPDVDLVVIASPSQKHAAQARTAIQAGKNVLVEIPMALSLGDVEDLASLARASSATVMVAHTSRYYPAVRELAERIVSGALHPHHIVSAMGTDKRRNRNQKGENRDWVDNLLWHHGLHVFDTILHLLDGDAVTSSAVHAGHRHPEHGGDMELSASLRFESGRLATIALTYHAAEQFTRYSLICDEAFLDYEQTLSSDNPRSLMQGGRFRDLVRQQDGDFLSACREGRPAPISPDDVLPAMRLLAQLQRQVDEARVAQRSESYEPT